MAFLTLATMKLNPHPPFTNPTPCPTLLATRGIIRTAPFKQLLWCLPLTISRQTCLAATPPVCAARTLAKCLQRFKLKLVLRLLIAMQYLLRLQGPSAFGLTPTHGLNPRTATPHLCVRNNPFIEEETTFPFNDEVILFAMKTHPALFITPPPPDQNIHATNPQVVKP